MSCVNNFDPKRALPVLRPTAAPLVKRLSGSPELPLAPSRPRLRPGTPASWALQETSLFTHSIRR